MQHNLKPSDTLYERIGGAPAINTIVGALYFNVLLDARLAHFFDEVPVERVLAHQRQFLSCAFGGMAGYDGRSLGEAHRHLIKHKGLNMRHFDALVDVLASTLTDLNVEQPLIDEVVAIVETTRNAIFSTE